MDLWGTDEYGYAVWTGTQPEAEHVPWGWLSRQTATPDVAVEMDRIYNETDVRGAMPSVTAPVLLLARENDRDALEYLATLLRQPQISLFPGADELKIHEQPAVLDVVREFVGVEPDAPELDTVLSTVLFTDIVGSTRKQAEMVTTGTRTCSKSITRSSETASAAGMVSSRTPQEMASTQRSMGRRARSAAPSRSANASSTSGSRSAPACTRASAS